ncbi:MAG: methyltransferase [Bacteroidetes bacterium]|nr:methyltransferase [Bacteroidota bacterium]
MKPFKFKQFQIQQSKSVFRVGTDGVLLGALSCVEGAKNILEIGTGTGLISLMLAQRNPDAMITALDIDENAVQLSDQNFKNSKFSSRLTSVCADFKSFQSEAQYDLIISNPPYFPENDSEKDVLARQCVALDFSTLIQNSARLLSSEGRISIIIPTSVIAEIKRFALSEGLNLVRQINLFGVEGGEAKRGILEFSKAVHPVEIFDFVIEKSPRQYSDSYLELTKEFHVFGG